MSSTTTMTATDAGETATLRPSLSPQRQPPSNNHPGKGSQQQNEDSEAVVAGAGPPESNTTAGSTGTINSPKTMPSESANRSERSNTQEQTKSEASAAVTESNNGSSRSPKKKTNKSSDTGKRSIAQEQVKSEASLPGAAGAVNENSSSSSDRPKKMPSESSSTNKAATAPAAKGNSSKSPKKKKKNKITSKGSTTDKRSKANSGIEVILPSQAETEALQVLELLDQHLNDRALKKSMAQWVVFTKKENGEVSQQVPGVRDIQNSRFEIFVQAGTEEQRKPTDAFDAIVGGMLETHKNDDRAAVLHDKSVDDVRDILIRYASQQARLDPRIQGQDYVFDNFSLLVNYGECDAQYPHIDLLAPNVQCGCVLTDKSPGTIAYQVPEPLRTVDDLKRLMWRDMPDSLQAALENNEDVMQLLSQFGDCLHPGRVELPPPGSNNNLRKNQNPPLYPRGTVLTLPGSVIHAGPPCSKYRCILFFSGWKRGSAVTGYNPDIQYFAPVLVADFITILFDQLSVSDRLYLIERLDFLTVPYKNLYRHLSDETMIKFTKALGWAQYGMGGKEELIKYFAEGKGVVPKGAILPPTKPQQRKMPELKLVSEDDLHTTWEGAPFAVQISRVVDDANPDRVQIYYPADGSWEGKDDRKIYTLAMDGGRSGIRTTRRSKFDGTNGTLRDDEGNEIVCFRQSSEG